METPAEIIAYCEREMASCDKKLLLLEGCDTSEAFTELSDEMLSDLFAFEKYKIQVRMGLKAVPQPVSKALSDASRCYRQMLSVYNDYKVVKGL